MKSVPSHTEVNTPCCLPKKWGDRWKMSEEWKKQKGVNFGPRSIYSKGIKVV